MDTKVTYQVSGMHCAACEMTIENVISTLPGVRKVNAKLKRAEVEVDFESSIPQDFITQANIALEDTNYQIASKESAIESSHDKLISAKELGVGFGITVVFFAIFLLLQRSGIVDSLLGNSSSQYWLTAFIVGIVASLSTCMAVVGGVVISLSAKYADGGRALPLGIFHLSRIISFFLLGGILGIIGSAFILSTSAVIIINLLLMIFMLSIGFNLLGLKLGFQPRMPKFISKAGIGNLENPKLSKIVLPILAGITTFFLPCGFTQTMQFTAFSTGNFVSGAITMLAFALGTFPVLGAISVLSFNLGKNKYRDYFNATAGFIVLGFSIISLLTILSLAGILPSTSEILGF